MPVNPRLPSVNACTIAGVVLVLCAVALSGCVASPSPVRSVDHAPTAGIAPLEVNFSVNSSDPGLGVTWDFGDGATGSGLQARHIYTAPGMYSAGARWTLPGGAPGNSSALPVAVYDRQHLPGNYSVGTLSERDELYLVTLQRKVDLFDQYYIEFVYLNKSHGTPMRYTSRDFQFAMKQSLEQLESMETSPALVQVEESARVLFTNATDGAYAEFLAGINLEKGRVEEADAHLARARPKMAVAKAERDRLVRLLEVLQ